LPVPPLPIHKNLVQIAIKHSTTPILHYLLNNSTLIQLDIDTICEHMVTATHSNKHEHIKILLDLFDDREKIRDLYYSKHTLYINFDYCFNYAYQKEHWLVVNVFVNNHHVNRMLTFINPKFKNLLYKFHSMRDLHNKPI